MDAEFPRVSDPQRVRALSHPLRLELMEVLRDGPATATECAALTGESVASCSFHLRMLAKYGWVQPDDRRGREKPWRLTTRGHDIRPDDDDPDSLRAVRATAELYLEHEAERIREWLAAATQEPAAWTQASTLCGLDFWATADEVAELSRTVQSLADRFDARRADPSLRPDGSRPVRLFATVHADIAKERRLERGATAG
jgi:predicted ArsR family transcriptional regulator